MYLDEVSRDRKPESEPAVLASRRAVSLAKSIEDVRQKLLANTNASIRNAHLNRTAATPVFSADLPDVPGKQLMVVNLTFPPAGGKPNPHKHPGSVWVYVTKGEARLGIEG